MTQQYLAGELSSLLAEVEPERGEELHERVEELRRRVERSPLRLLPPLAEEALALADAVCWAELDRGDADRFRRCSGAAAALADFSAGAGYRP